MVDRKALAYRTLAVAGADRHDGLGFPQGTLELTIRDRTFVLQAGDSFQFPSSDLHRYHNPGPGETVVIWAMTPPSY